MFSINVTQSTPIRVIIRILIVVVLIILVSVDYYNELILSTLIF